MDGRVFEIEIEKGLIIWLGFFTRVADSRSRISIACFSIKNN